MDPLKLVQRYTLLQRIAEGSYGEVYKARSNSTKELVAVKRFKTIAKVGLPISFVRQHYILNLLQDKHIPEVLQVFSGEQPPAIVMQWLSLSLQQVVKSKKKYSIKQIFMEIVMAVDYLHTYGVLHRDLKPSNIMLGPRITGNAPNIEPQEISPQYYSVKLIDFGMAREVDWHKGDMTNQVGTLFYRAPQLLLGERKYNQKIDIWSLGCIFYFMQTGSLLFKGNNQMQQFQAIASVLGLDLSEISNPKMRNTLLSMKIEQVEENWSLIDKQINEIEFDLLKKMIALEPERRLSCKQLLIHPYFMSEANGL